MALDNVVLCSIFCMRFHHLKVMRGSLLTEESIHKLLLYMVVSAPGELNIQECCNFVDDVQAHLF